MSRIRKYLRQNRLQNRVEEKGNGPSMEEQLTFPYKLEDTMALIKQQFGPSPDLIYREFEIEGAAVRQQAAIIYIDNLADKQLVDDYIMRPLIGKNPEVTYQPADAEVDKLNQIMKRILPLGEPRIIDDWNQVLSSIISGDTAILLDGCAKVITGSTKGGQFRAISEPTTEVVIRGPKDSFNEVLATNASLIRHRIQSPDLWMESRKMGMVTRTNVAIMYIKGIAEEKNIQEVRRRLDNIATDSILESGYIEEYIQDEWLTPFPTVYNTERPDVVSANLLEGRIAILVDGTPFVLVVPTTMSQFFHSAEDYYQRYDISTFIRLLRYFSFAISILGPSIYIAVITFHQEMIPTSLLISLAASREGVPFPAIVEALIMEISLEVLREAGVRMPRAVGQAVSIIGALVLGQAAVQAGIVSPAMVIVVSITGIASFSTPSFNLAISARLIRFLLMAMAAGFGFYGLTLALICLVAHLNSLRSFGVPYLAAFSPIIPKDQKDNIFRAPRWMMVSRPVLLTRINSIRQSKRGTPPDSGSSSKGGGEGSDES